MRCAQSMLSGLTEARPVGGISPRPESLAASWLALSPRDCLCALAAGLLVRTGLGTYALPGVHSDYLDR
jgi:hypothetical protein